ncbi:MAG: hypothetical protein AMXMBFR84_50720 [Candidatus Hydrogenedentota bacterium]
MCEEKHTRRQFMSEDKAATVKRHVVGGEAVSSICEDLGVAPNLFYRWQQELFDNAAAAFEVKGRCRRPDAKARTLERENKKLRSKLAHKDNVIAEITEDYVKLKKHLARVEGCVDRTGRAGRGGGFRGHAKGKDGHQPEPAGALGRHWPLEVLRLEAALWQGERTQRSSFA